MWGRASEWHGSRSDRHPLLMGNEADAALHFHHREMKTNLGPFHHQGISGGGERHQFEPGRTVLHVTRIQNLPVNSSSSLLIYWVSCSMMISWVTIKLKSCCIILHHIYVMIID